MAQGEYVRTCEKSGAADGGAMVHDLDEGIVFVGNGGVVDVDKAIGAA